MKKSDELKKELRELVTSQDSLVKKAEGEKRSLTTEENTEFDDLQSKIDEKRAEIKRAEAREENLRSIGAGGESQMRKPGGEDREQQEMQKRYSFHRAIRSQLPNGKLDGVELEVHQEIVKRAKDAGVAIEGVGIPTSFRGEKRFAGQSVTLDNGEYGGALVSDDLQSDVIEFLRPNPVVRQLGARFLTGLQGNVVFPVNEGGIAASWEGEADAIDQTKNKYSNKTMTPKRLGVSVPITLQNLIQSSIDLEQYTMDEINAAFAVALDTAILNGSGSGNVPLGILNAPGVNALAMGTNGGAPDWATLVKAGVLVRTANAGNLPGAKFAWAINPATSGKLETTQKVSGQSIFLIENGKIGGYPYQESNLLPSNITKGTGTNLSAAIFGDWNQALIGQWGFVDVTVDNISKKSEGYIQIIVNAFYDTMLRQPKAFTTIKDWVTA